MNVIAYDAHGRRLADAPPPTLDVRENVPFVVCDAHPARFVATVFRALEAGAVPLLVAPRTPRNRVVRLVKNVGASGASYADSGDASEAIQGRARELHLAEPAFLACTSGTTSDTPSVYGFSLARARENALAHLDSLGLAGASGLRFFLPLPLAHAFGFVAGVLAAEATEGDLHVTTDVPSSSPFFELIARERIEVLHTTPTHLRSLARLKLPAAGADTTSLRVVGVGSQRVSARDAAELARHFPLARRYATYGLTECGPRVATLDLRSLASSPNAGEATSALPIGAPLRGVALALDGTDTDGADTELVVTTPYLALGTLGAAGFEPLDAEAPFHTRDRARATGDSFELLGRADGVIVRGGTNVYPSTIEYVAESVPGVCAACAIAKHSEAYGEVPILIVERDDTVSAESLKRDLERALTDALTSLERPVEIHVFDSLPRTSLGKVQRAVVAAQLEVGRG